MTYYFQSKEELDHIGNQIKRLNKTKWTNILMLIFTAIILGLTIYIAFFK